MLEVEDLFIELLELLPDRQLTIRHSSDFVWELSVGPYRIAANRNLAQCLRQAVVYETRTPETGLHAVRHWHRKLLKRTPE